MQRPEHTRRNSGLNKDLPDGRKLLVGAIYVLAEVHDVVLFIVDTAMERRPCDPGRQTAIVCRHGFVLRGLPEQSGQRRLGMLRYEMIQHPVGNLVHFEHHDLAGHANFPSATIQPAPRPLNCRFAPPCGHVEPNRAAARNRFSIIEEGAMLWPDCTNPPRQSTSGEPARASNMHCGGEPVATKSTSRGVPDFV